MNALELLRRHQYDDGMTKRRVTVTLDAELVEVANQVVASGRAESVSAWVNAALARESERDRLLQNGREAIAAYEAQYGAFTEEELVEQARVDREEIARNRERFARLGLET